MDARTRVDTQVVGALPLVGAMLEQWGLADIVDRVVPWEGDVPLGTLVEVLVTNRLLNPKAMYAVGDWAAAAAVTDYLRSDRRATQRRPAGSGPGTPCRAWPGDAKRRHAGGRQEVATEGQSDSLRHLQRRVVRGVSQRSTGRGRRHGHGTVSHEGAHRSVPDLWPHQERSRRCQAGAVRPGRAWRRRGTDRPVALGGKHGRGPHARGQSAPSQEDVPAASFPVSGRHQARHAREPGRGPADGRRIPVRRRLHASRCKHASAK